MLTCFSHQLRCVRRVVRRRAAAAAAAAAGPRPRLADGGRRAGANNKYRDRTRFKSTRARDINLPVALCGKAPECLSLVRRPRRAGRASLAPSPFLGALGRSRQGRTSVLPTPRGRPHSRSHAPLALWAPHLTWRSHASSHFESTFTTYYAAGRRSRECKSGSRASSFCTRTSPCAPRPFGRAWRGKEQRVDIAWRVREREKSRRRGRM